MNVRATHSSSRAHLARHRPALFALLALATALFGLLAMHSFVTTSAGTPAEGHTHAIFDATASAPVTAQWTSSEVSTVPASVPVCDGVCQLDGLMFGVMCAIGTIAAGLTMFLSRRRSPHIVPAPLTCVSAAVARHVAQLRPPSLSILCISRT